jgi:hypothetical protein
LNEEEAVLEKNQPIEEHTYESDQDLEKDQDA